MSYVHQIIKHEYNSDDGHYDHEPFEDLVYARQVDAVQVRDALNLVHIRLNNERTATEVARRCAIWKERGCKMGETPVINRHDTQVHDYLSVKGIALFEERCTFTGDPANPDDIEKFATRDRNNITYFTIVSLRVFS
jgi:hypothetical protein